MSIVDTWLQYVRDKRTVAFCASVKHTQQIAELFQEAGIRAASVSGGLKQSERREFQDKFVSREIQVLCACDLLNEGWDCVEIEKICDEKLELRKGRQGPHCTHQRKYFH